MRARRRCPHVTPTRVPRCDRERARRITMATAASVLFRNARFVHCTAGAAAADAAAATQAICHEKPLW